MLAAIALAGGAGAVARFVADALITARVSAQVPVGTLCINVAGSFLLGLLAGVAAAAGPDTGAGAALAIAGTGFCGGFTTFSTASVDTARLLLQHRRIVGACYALGTALVSVGAAGAGLWLGHLLAHG